MTSFEWGVAILVCACLVAMVLLKDTRQRFVAGLLAATAFVYHIWRNMADKRQPNAEPEPPLTPDPEPKHRETDAKIRELDESGTVYLDVPDGVDMAKVNRLRAKIDRRRREGLPNDNGSGDAD